jgi:hypothetical protein
MKKDKRLELLSDEVRKGNPIGLREAMEVVEYQTQLKNEREVRSEKRFRMIMGLLTNIVCVLGGMALVLGEIDDSPGLGGIGLIAIAGSMYYNSKLLYKIK